MKTNATRILDELGVAHTLRVTHATAVAIAREKRASS